MLTIVIILSGLCGFLGVGLVLTSRQLSEALSAVQVLDEQLEHLRAENVQHWGDAHRHEARLRDVLMVTNPTDDWQERGVGA